MRTKPLRYSTLWPLAVLLCSGAGARAQNALLFVEPADGTFDGFANFGTAAAISGRTAPPPVNAGWPGSNPRGR